MKQYFIEVDQIHPLMVYIYEDSENSRKLKVTVYNDFDLARFIVDELNKNEERLNWAPD